MQEHAENMKQSYEKDLIKQLNKIQRRYGKQTSEGTKGIHSMSWTRFNVQVVIIIKKLK